MPLTEEGTSKFIQAGPLKLHYHEAGKGPALIMIHGGGPGAGGWSNYRRNVDHFAEHFRVILPDLPGFAKSDKPKIEGGMFGFMAKAIHGLMDALDIPRANFVGNSLGGGTTLKFALDYPDRAQRIVLMGAPGLPVFTPQPAEGIKYLLDYYEKPGPSMEKLRNFLNVMVYDGSQLTDQLIKERYEASIQPDLDRESGHLAQPPLRAGAAVEGFCEDQKQDAADLGTRRSHRHARQRVAACSISFPTCGCTCSASAATGRNGKRRRSSIASSSIS